MNLWRRCFCDIYGRMFRSLSIVAFIIVFAISALIVEYLVGVSESYTEYFGERYGNKIYIFNNKEKDIPLRLLNQIDTDSNVKGYNCNTSIMVEPIGIQNYVKYYESDFENKTIEKEIILWGNTNTMVNDCFINELFEITGGEFPESESNQILVEEEFAKYNSLTIGDFIEVSSTVEGEYISLQISGMYKVNMPMEISTQSTNGENIYVQSPYSYVFADYSVMGKVDLSLVYRRQYEIIVDNLQNIEKVKKQIEDILGEDGAYEISDSVENAEIGFSSIALILRNSVQILVLTIYISAYLILIIMTYLWMRNHLKEASIYIALGRRRIYILGEFLIEILIISLFGLLIANVWGNVIICLFKNNIIEKIIGISQTTVFYQELDKKLLQHTLNTIELIKADLLIIMTILISSLVSGICIFTRPISSLYNAKK